MSRPSAPAIDVTALRKLYVTKRGTFRRTKVENLALDGIDLAIQPGELFGLLGPHGACNRRAPIQPNFLRPVSRDRG